ncbi:MAG: M23 family metallopeptidase [Deltaproteobacteria bacterium]|nr:M23 family metallopeptidase [Deltaproteobacteria bacterium]
MGERAERTEPIGSKLVEDLMLPEAFLFAPFCDDQEEEATHLAPPLVFATTSDEGSELEENATELEMAALAAPKRRRVRRIGGALSLLASVAVAGVGIALEVERIDQEKLELLSENRELRDGKLELAQRVRTLDEDLERAERGLEARRSILESIPVQVPVDAVTTSGFGTRRDPFSARTKHHDGVDYGAPRGTPVTATADGEVSHAGPRGSYGNLVQIDHGEGLSTRFAHLSKVLVPVGESVKRGQIIGLVGSTGKSTAPHLHYEVWVDDRPLDPAFLMRVWRKLSSSVATAEPAQPSTAADPSGPPS